MGAGAFTTIQHHDEIVFKNLRFYPSTRGQQWAFSKMSTLENVFEKMGFRRPILPDSRGLSLLKLWEVKSVT